MNPPAEKGRTLVYERLRRLLFLVPFVSRNQGMKVDEVAKAAGLSTRELLQDLELLTLVGRPPFEPDDFVDIYVEEDRVFVDLDQRLSAPPRLTAAEGVALAAAAELLRPAAGDALRSALQKLEAVLPAQALEQYRSMGRQLDVTVQGPTGLSTITRGIIEKREVEFDYLTANKHVSERRRVQPHELFSFRGEWYLSGHCLTRAGQRLFRFDRLSNASVTGASFVPPEKTQGARLPTNEESQTLVTVRFEAASAPYIVERFGEQARATGEGRVEVDVPGDSERWVTQWVLSFGGDAVVTAPEWARQAVFKAASAWAG